MTLTVVIAAATTVYLLNCVEASLETSATLKKITCHPPTLSTMNMQRLVGHTFTHMAGNCATVAVKEMHTIIS